MRNIRHLTWWIGGGVVLVFAAWWGWRARNTAIEVDAATIASGPLRITVNEAGTTRVRLHSDVNAPTAGRWVPRALRNGDSVRVGQPLGALYPTPLDASAQEQARARLGSAEASFREAESRIAAARSVADDAQRNLDRIDQVARAGGVSPQDLERARTAAQERRSEFDAVQLRVQIARFEVEATRSVVESFGSEGRAIAIVAPVGGRLLHLYEEHPRVLGPGTPLAEVGDPGDLEVVVPLLTTDAMRMKIGADVRMIVGVSGDTLLGHVTLVEPSAFTRVSALGVDEQRVNVIVTAPSPIAAAAMHLGDRYRVEARITVWESPDVVRVPTAALVRDGDAWLVFLLSSERARQRVVRIGERGDEFAQLLSGLSLGEQVILYPGDRIRDGLRVRMRGRVPEQ